MGLMQQLQGLFGKAKQYADQHPDQVRSGLDKAEAMIDKQTGGKYGGQITKAGDAAEKALGVDPAQPGQAQPGQAQPGQAQPGQAQPGQAQPGQPGQ